MALSDLRFDVIGRDQFSSTFRRLGTSARAAERDLARLEASFKRAAAAQRELNAGVRRLNTAALAAGAGGGRGGGGVGDLATIGLTRSFLSGGVKGGLLAGGAVGVAAFGALETARAVGEQGKLGASNLQLARSFDRLTAQVGLYSDKLRSELIAQTQGTVSAQRLMSESNLLLSAAQQQNIVITEEQIGKVAALARIRSTQLTAEGRQITTAEAFSRIVRGTVKRETELLDELGISTKQLADIMGVSVKEVNNSVESLLGALVRVADQEIERFGLPFEDEATRIAQSEARIEDSLNKIRANLAEPTAVALEIVATGVERIVNENQIGREIATIFERLDAITVPIDVIVEAREEDIAGQFSRRGLFGLGARVGDTPAIQEQIEALERLEETAERIDDLSKRLQVGAKAEFFDDPQAEVEALRNLETSLAGLGEAVFSIQGLGDLGFISPDQAAASSAEVERLFSLLEDQGVPAIAQVTAALGQLDNSLDLLVGSMDIAATQTQDLVTFLQELAVIDPRRALAVQAGLVADLTEDEAGLLRGRERSREDPAATQKRREEREREEEKARQEVIRSLRGLVDAQEGYALATRDTAGKIAFFQKRLGGLDEGSEEFVRTQTTLVRLNDRLASEQETAARKAISSLEDLDSAFRSALSGIAGIPGISGRTQVTEQQLQLARLGLDRPRPDEALRRAEDVLINRVPRGDVNINLLIQAAAQARGQDARALAGLPGELLFQIIEEEFTSGRIFGTAIGQANIGELLNVDAVREGLRAQNLADIGREFVLDALRAAGLGPAAAGRGGGGLAGFLPVGGEGAFFGVPGVTPGVGVESLLGEGGFAGLTEALAQQLATSGFGAQAGSIIRQELTGEDAQEEITGAAPVIASTFNNALIESIEESELGARILNVILGLINEAAVEATP